MMETPETPDDDLQAFMTRNKIIQFWPQVHEKLGVTSIEQLQYLGKEAVLQYLVGVPALPLIKLAELADASNDHFQRKV